MPEPRDRTAPARRDASPRTFAQGAASLDPLTSEYPSLAMRGLSEMEAALRACRAGRADGATLREFRRLAQRFRDEGATFGYPIVSAIAASLCLLLEHGYARVPAGQPVVEAHLVALKAVLDARMAGPAGVAGRRLLEVLRDRVAGAARAVRDAAGRAAGG